MPARGLHSPGRAREQNPLEPEPAPRLAADSGPGRSRTKPGQAPKRPGARAIDKLRSARAASTRNPPRRRSNIPPGREPQARADSRSRARHPGSLGHRLTRNHPAPNPLFGHRARFLGPNKLDRGIWVKEMEKEETCETEATWIVLYRLEFVFRQGRIQRGHTHAAAWR